MKTRLYLIANWKMNLTPQKAVSFVKTFTKKYNQSKTVETVIAPNASFLPILQPFRKKISLAAQNISHVESGAYTGETSAEMIQPFCNYVLIGHSERRLYFFEDDELVAEKTRLALKHKLTPIVCVGESLAQRNQGKTKRVLAKQVKSALLYVPKKNRNKILFAYEPVWAIGTGKIPSFDDIEESTRFIKSLTSRKQIVLYGGSASPKNAAALLSISSVSGLLVGSASLNIKTFTALHQITRNLAVSLRK
jgi:triosephosphate isomerase (TIM)